MRKTVLTFPVLLVICASWLVASAAIAQEPLPLADRFTFSVHGGVQAFDYREKSGPIESDFDSIGPAWGVAASLRVAELWRLNASYLGSFIPTETETWQLGTFFGIPVTQENDLKVDFHAVDIDVSFSVLKIPEVEWSLAGGWHFYRQNFERSNLAINVLNFTFPLGIQPVSEEVNGYGLKLGTTLDWKLGGNWIASTGVSGYYLYHVGVENSLLGNVDSEGWAARWRFAVDYLMTSNASIGVGYEGHFIHVDEATRGGVTLPDNRTFANTVLLRLNVRF